MDTTQPSPLSRLVKWLFILLLALICLITSTLIVVLTRQYFSEKSPQNPQPKPSTVRKIPSKKSITILCQNFISDTNQWQITVHYNTTKEIKNAKKYWLRIGTTPKGNQALNLITSPIYPNEIQTYMSGDIFHASDTYYAQYAYTTCATCTSFSQFSPTRTFTCSASPTATPSAGTTPLPISTNTTLPSPLPFEKP
jgi:hypothetical protein